MRGRCGRALTAGEVTARWHQQEGWHGSGGLSSHAWYWLCACIVAQIVINDTDHNFVQLLLAGDMFYPNVFHLDDLPAGCPSGSRPPILFCSWSEQGACTPSCTWAPKHVIFSPSWRAAVAALPVPGCSSSSRAGPRVWSRSAWRSDHRADIPAPGGHVARRQRVRFPAAAEGAAHQRKKWSRFFFFVASSSVDPAPDMKVDLISLHKQPKLSG